MSPHVIVFSSTMPPHDVLPWVRKQIQQDLVVYRKKYDYVLHCTPSLADSILQKVRDEEAPPVAETLIYRFGEARIVQDVEADPPYLSRLEKTG